MNDIKFGQLFSIELLHKYASDQLCNDFTMVPSERTKQLLKNYQIVVKQYNNGLYAGTNLDPNALGLTPSKQVPFILPEEGLQLTFFLVLDDPLFFNYTGIHAANIDGKIFYFSNRNNNSSNNKNFLTQPLKNYAAGTYSIEDIVIDSGSVYQSLKDNNPDGLANINSWRQVLDPDPNHPGSNIPDPNRFMSSDDLLSWIPSVSQVALNAITTNINVQVTGYNGSGNYTQPVFAAVIDNPDSLPSFLLDLSGLQSGKYLLSVNGSLPKPIYLNDELSNKTIFGVIDLYIESTLPAAYKILKAPGNQLTSPLYSIYFLNRATIWKYIFTRTSNAVMTDPSSFYQFSTTLSPPSPTIVTSKFPIPLSETPIKLVLDGQLKPSPPCASAERLATVNPGSVYYSEIFLNS